MTEGRSRILTFDAIDVETANVDRASICSVGVVQVRDGVIEDRWESLINPESWFDPMNVEIHGIDESKVRNSPTFREIHKELCVRLGSAILVSHMAFDRVALERTADRYGLEHLSVEWLDSAKIVRRAWPEKYGRRGYGLTNVANDLGISFQHHDALEDAKPAAEIVLRVCEATEMDIEKWLNRVRKPIFPSTAKRNRNPRPKSSVKREGNPEGELYGETVVFTGALHLPRREAADLAANLGCDVATAVGKKTTMIVVGTQRSLAQGYDKSSKHRDAEALIKKGEDIQILSELDFCGIAGIEPPNDV